MNTKFFKLFITTIITFFLLFFLLSNLDIRNIIKVFHDSNKTLFILAALVAFSSNFLVAFRWKLILNILGCPIDYKRSIKICLANMPIAKILPVYSGDFLRTVYIKESIPISKSSGGIFFEAMLDILVLSLMSFVGSFFINLKKIKILSLLIILIILLLIVLFNKLNWKFFKKWQGKLINFTLIFKIFLKKKKILASVVLFTILMWYVTFFTIKLAFLAVGIDMPFLYIQAIQPIVTFITLLPITIWGIGTREASMLYLYANFGSNASIISVGFFYSFFGGIFFPLLFLPLTFFELKKINR